MKLNNMCGDLVQKMNMKESFLSEMMYDGVLSHDKKKDIQTVCGFVLLRLIHFRPIAELQNNRRDLVRSVVNMIYDGMLKLEEKTVIER